MSELLALRESSWMDARTEFRIWNDLGRNYGVEVHLVDAFTAWWFKRRHVVLVDERGDHELAEFEHPSECMYVFGRTHENDLMEGVPFDTSVRVTTARPGVSLFGICVASMLLADRERKWQSR